MLNQGEPVPFNPDNYPEAHQEQENYDDEEVPPPR